MTQCFSRLSCLTIMACSALLVGACVSVDVGHEPPVHTHHALRDGALAGVEHRATPLVPALLIQPLPAGAVADTLAMAYARQPNQYAFYQFANWTERPVRALPRLLQQRLEARGAAGAVGLLGEPLRADWLLTMAVDQLHHDLHANPAQARVAVTIELIDRRLRQRIARRQFEASAPVASEDAGGAASAMAVATGQLLDAATPWIEAELTRAAR